MTKLTEAKDNFLAELGGLQVTIAGQQHPVQFPRMAEWQAVEAVPGLWMRPIPVPEFSHSDYFMTQGLQGVHAEEASIPQGARMTVQSGAILWRQQHANGGEPYRLEEGDTVRLAPYERHSYVFLTDCVNSLVITPPLSSPVYAR